MLLCDRMCSTPGTSRESTGKHMAKLSLSAVQRLGLLGAACTISWLLWSEIDRYGLDRTHWLAPIIVVVALLLVASDGWAPVLRPMARQSLNASSGRDWSNELLGVKNRLTRFLKAGVQARTKGLGTQFLEETGGYVDSVALKWAFMLILVRYGYGKSDYEKASEVTDLRMLVIGQLANSMMQDMQRMAVPGERPTRKAMLEVAFKEISKCEVAVRDALNNLAANVFLPFDPILLIVNRELGLCDNSSPARAECYQAEIAAVLADV